VPAGVVVLPLEVPDLLAADIRDFFHKLQVA